MQGRQPRRVRVEPPPAAAPPRQPGRRRREEPQGLRRRARGRRLVAGPVVDANQRDDQQCRDERGLDGSESDRRVDQRRLFGWPDALRWQLYRHPDGHQQLRNLRKCPSISTWGRICMAGHSATALASSSIRAAVALRRPHQPRLERHHCPRDVLPKLSELQQWRRRHLGRRDPGRGGAGVQRTTGTGLSPGIAANAAYAYFTQPGDLGGSDGEVIALSILDGGTSPLATGQDAPWAIAIDATSIYWTNKSTAGTSNGAILKMPLAGGNPLVLVSGQASPWGIAVNSRVRTDRLNARYKMREAGFCRLAYSTSTVVLPLPATALIFMSPPAERTASCCGVKGCFI